MSKRPPAAKPPKPAKSKPAKKSADVGTTTVETLVGPVELPIAPADFAAIAAPPKSLEECLVDLHELVTHLEHAPSQAVKSIALDAQKRIAAILASIRTAQV